MGNTAEYKVYENQSWLDISNVLYGSSQYAYELSQQNNSSITDEIKAGTIIVYSKDIQSNQLVLLSMASYKSNPATAIQHQEMRVEKLNGIDYWAIQSEFIIS
ncbi:MAG: hypothetical protein Q4A00_05550 [Flavobacteriaceae bacterium]|nr:hypothetical protein [Flavobacteriaceae bacterium]